MAAAQAPRREVPDALLPTLGGQTALNLAMDLAEKGILERYGVDLIGAKPCNPCKFAQAIGDLHRVTVTKPLALAFVDQVVHAKELSWVLCQDKVS